MVLEVSTFEDSFATGSKKLYAWAKRCDLRPSVLLSDPANFRHFILSRLAQVNGLLIVFMGRGTKRRFGTIRLARRA